jgi:hypothetical protein
MTDNDIEYGHKTVRDRYPSNRLIIDVDEFFQGSSVTKQVSAFSIAKITQEMVSAFIR